MGIEGVWAYTYDKSSPRTGAEAESGQEGGNGKIGKRRTRKKGWCVKKGVTEQKQEEEKQ